MKTHISTKILYKNISNILTQNIEKLETNQMPINKKN